MNPRLPATIWASWAAVLALLVIVFAPGLGGGFFFDDLPNIVKNESVHIQTLSFDSLAASTLGLSAGPLGRPVSVISFALTHYFFGLDACAFKAVNLLIHAINGVLVFWLLRLFLSGRVAEATARWLALWVAAAWLLHPINVTPVLLAVQRMTLLSATFLLLACIAHLKAFSVPEKARPNWRWLAAGWLVFWPFSFLSKENGLLFPLFVLAAAWFAPSPSPRWRRAVNRALAMLLAAGAVFVLMRLDWLQAGYQSRTFTLDERLLTEARVLWFYLAQTWLPDFRAFGLYHDGFPISRGLLQPVSTLFAILGWIVAVFAILRFRLLWPLPCLGVAWFLVGHGMESTFFALELVFEHRNYVPSLGLLLAAGRAGVALLEKMPRRRHATVLALALLPLLYFAALSGMRAQQLGDPVNGPIREAALHPDSARAYYSAALALIAAGRGERNDPAGWAIIRRHFLQSEAAEPTFKHGYLGLMAWACLTRRPVEPAWLGGLAHRLEYAPFWNKDSGLHYDMLEPLQAMPDCLPREDALRLFEAGARNETLGAGVRAGFYKAATLYELRVARDPISARGYLDRAIALAPDDPGLRRFLARLAASAPYSPE